MGYYHYCKCGKLIPYGVKYCDSCRPILEEQRKESERAYNKRRDIKYVNFYKSKDWVTLSRTYAKDHGYKCEECGRIASNVHHRTPIQTEAGWKRRLDYNGLQLLCVSCHNKVHGRFYKK